jgi:hypothetical protein
MTHSTTDSESTIYKTMTIADQLFDDKKLSWEAYKALHGAAFAMLSAITRAQFSQPLKGGEQWPIESCDLSSSFTLYNPEAQT